MSGTATIPWQDLRTDETRSVEDVLRGAGFRQVDAYRYNAAAIRVRIIDPRFEGLRDEQRLALVEPPLERLPERTQADILTLFVFAPSELVEPTRNFRKFAQNVEFVDYTPSML